MIVIVKVITIKKWKEIYVRRGDDCEMHQIHSISLIRREYLIFIDLFMVQVLNVCIFFSFRKMFRLSKEAFEDVLIDVTPLLKKGKRVSHIPSVLKVASTLRFFAEGGYQTGTGNDFCLGLAQSTLSTIMKETLNVLQSVLCSKWIITRMSGEEKMEAKRYFYINNGFPGIIGCIDGTHVKIRAPSPDLRHLYYNRKGFYSLNVTIVSKLNQMN